MAEPRWVAACEHWISRPYPTQAQAVRKAADIDHMGNCPTKHEAIEVAYDEHRILRLPDGRQVP